MFVSLHTLWSLPPNGLNRDGFGHPKSFRFGDAQRAYVSSQSLKRARRLRMIAAGTPASVRTRLIRDHLAEALFRRGRPDLEEARQVATKALLSIGLGMDKKAPERTQYMLLLGLDEVERVVDVLNRAEVYDALLAATRTPTPAEEEEPEEPEEPKPAPRGRAKPVSAKKTARSAPETREAREALLAALTDTSRAVDLALFGRLVADLRDLDVQGAAQVAHSIGVCSSRRHTDYFATVDDLAAVGESQSGMLGTTTFAADMLYSHTAVDIARLRSNLKGDENLVREGLTAYLWASAEALPSGKQNSMLAATRPSLLLGVVGRSPLSFANAFLRSVRAYDSDGDLSAAAVDALDRHLVWCQRTYGRRDMDVALSAGAQLPQAGVERVAAEHAGAEVGELMDRLVSTGTVQ